MARRVFSQEEENIYLQFYSSLSHNVSVKELVFFLGACLCHACTVKIYIQGAVTC